MLALQRPPTAGELGPSCPPHDIDAARLQVDSRQKMVGEEDEVLAARSREAGSPELSEVTSLPSGGAK